MPAPESPRGQVLAAVVAVAGRVGLTRLTVEEVASEAGVSRASVYRWFPGGRDQLVDEGITFEVARFLDGLEAAMGDAADLGDRLVRAVLHARRAIDDHAVLQHILATEPGALLPQLQQTAPVVLGVVRDTLLPHVAAAPGRRPDVDPGEATDYVARMLLSFLMHPGRWDLADPAEVRRLVETELLAGIIG